VSRILPADGDGLDRAADALRAGRAVAFPTETVYGLGAVARDPRAVARVFALKGRPSDHPLIVHVAGAEELPDWIDPVPAGALALARAFWPGPLTLVGPRAAGVPDAVTGGQSTVALRCPAHPVARALLARLGSALAAPSANRFGRLSPTRAEHVAEEFADEDLLVLDGGPCEVGLESTIVDLSGPAPRLLRPGAIGREAMAEVLGRPLELTGDEDGDVPRAPGRLRSHYAPRAPIRIVDAGALPAAVAPGEAALLRRAEAPAGTLAERLPRDPAGYGRGLYAALRRLDAAAPRAIVVEAAPEDEAWRAVRDRLARAAAPRPEGEDR
jgi:L-threonylcarbamoyladenylate synthase